MQPVIVEREVGGRILRFETGRLAKQAHGAVLVQFGETVVLTAATQGDPRGDGDFFPLTVDYRERTYAAGKYPGGFKKREGAPSNKEILTMRLTDRPLRPLFPEGYVNEVQIMTTVLASDRQNDPDVLSINGASAALVVSPLPFQGPIAAVRMGMVGDDIIVMPTASQINEGKLDLVVAGTDEAVCMIEGFAKELTEERMVEAILAAHAQIKVIIDMQRELRGKLQLPPPAVPAAPDHSLYERIRAKYYDAVRQAKQRMQAEGKLASHAAVAVIGEEVKKEFVSQEPKGTPSEEQVAAAFHHLQERAVRDLILTGTRPDGRKADDIRAIHTEVAVLPRVHGSALFQRGETQALMVATLGSPDDEQKVDGLGEEYSKKFMLDYNFPPFSVGECRAIRGPGRREIGHGALAERSLLAVIPTADKFPYTIRLVSEILESNGSSSMATVCAGTLCLMDAGVPITDPVAGISIGLVKEGDSYTLLTDIQGDEDHFGDMDFKVAGTQRGITGIQLDLKITGISEQIIRETLQHARTARIHILKQILRTLKRPRREISPFAPKLLKIKIDPEKIGMIIGPGGKNIRALQEETKTHVSIEDDGTVTIAGPDSEAVDACRNRVEAIAEDVKVGRIYKGKVTAIKDFGAFVEIVPGRDGLCHISELAEGYVNRVTDVCRVGDVLEVKVIGIDDHNRVKLSRKVLFEKQPDDGNGEPEVAAPIADEED